jgi:acetyl esterase/lipase
VLWLHGGGFLIGTPKQDDLLCRQIADELGVVVAAPAYRLAPKHRFPAALEDAYAALQWLAKRDDVDASRIAVAGASAGGGLAAQVALHARDLGEVALAAQILVYPMLDDRTALRTDLDESAFRLWDNRSNRIGWSAYLGHDAGAAEASTIAVPPRNEDLRGLPPAWIGVGALDLFRDEDMAYAERLRAAGVTCETIVVDGVFHGFDGIKPDSAATKRFRESMLAAMTRSLSPAA